MSAAEKLKHEDLTDTIHQLCSEDHIRLKFEMYGGPRTLHTQTLLNFARTAESIENFALQEITWVPALFTLIRELIDNSLDEFSHGFGDKLEVTYNDQSIEVTVKDNGRGIPFDKVLSALTEPMTGRNFGERLEVVGTNGYGASIVSITSAKFIFIIHREGKIFEQTIHEGEPGIGGRMKILAPIISNNPSNLTGTQISFQPSFNVFKHRILPSNYVKSRLFEIATCNPRYRIFYNGELLQPKAKIEESLFPNHKTIKIEINNKAKKFNCQFWLVPNFVNNGDHYHSIVNNIFTANGGCHIDGFRKLFFTQLLKALEPISKRHRLIPNRSDFTENLLVFNITKMHRPDFDGQSKTRLINSEVNEIITNFFENEDFFKKFIRDNKEWIDEVFQRCSERTKKKDAGDLAKLSRKMLKNKVPGLMDATGSKRQQCILILGEGDSSLASVSSVRNPDIHGGLALRGKILNVNGESLKKVLENKVLVEIMNSIGLITNQKAVRTNLRYGKIYIATDSDPDGGSIATLLINFFYTFWPELFDETQPPFIYLFQTPFVILEKGKQRKYFYSHNYDQFKPNDWTGWSITRAKGLGSLTEVDWTYSLDHPICIPIQDNGKLQEVLDLIFNSARSGDRKVWLGL